MKSDLVIVDVEDYMSRRVFSTINLHERGNFSLFGQFVNRTEPQWKSKTNY